MRFRKRPDAQSSPADVYERLRQQVLGLTPDQLGGGSFAEEPILALLMETRYPEAVATLVAVADGTTSLYFSNGGGVIGAGTHAAVAEASERWLEAGRAALRDLPDVTDPALPADGMTQFLTVTPTALRGLAVPEAELGEGRHSLTPLFYAGQDVITQIRLAEGS
jgi:hypothetical protein